MTYICYIIQNTIKTISNSYREFFWLDMDIRNSKSNSTTHNYF